MSALSLPIRRPSPALVVSLLALLMASAGMASAAIPDANDVIHGCIVSRTGTLRVIDTETSPPGACTSKEKPLTWGQTGPTGDPGPAGSITGTYLRRVSGFVTTASVACDAGDAVTGGGASSDGTLTDVYPYTSGFGSDVPIAYSATRSGGSQVTVYVICVDITP